MIGESTPHDVIACAAREGLGEPPASSRLGSNVTAGCMVFGGPSEADGADDAEAAVSSGREETDGTPGPAAATNTGDAETSVAKGGVEADGVPGPAAAANTGDAETSVAKGEVEADGVPGPAAAVNTGDAETPVAKGEVEANGIPGIMASFPPGENDTAASAMFGETVGAAAATADGRFGIAGRPSFLGGATSANTGSGRVLPCMKVRTRDGCEDRGAAWEGVEAIRCGECTRALSTNSFPLGVVGELLYGVRVRVTPGDGAAVFP
jgi:hypothetical protein